MSNYLKVSNPTFKSKFYKAVRAIIEKRGIPISTIGVMDPFGIGLSQKKEVVVSSFHEHCVSTFSISGERL